MNLGLLCWKYWFFLHFLENPANSYNSALINQTLNEEIQRKAILVGISLWKEWRIYVGSQER